MFQTMQLMQQTMQQMLPTQQQNPIPQSGRVQRPDRPTIEIDSTDSDWSMFLDSWGRYKTMTKLSDQVQIRNELRSTCSAVVNKLLFDFVGANALNTCTEEGLLAHIPHDAASQVRQTCQPGDHKSGHDPPPFPCIIHVSAHAIRSRGSPLPI